MNPNNVTWLTLSELQEMTVGSCDFGYVSDGDYADVSDLWTDIVNYKSRDTGFGWLVENMAENGWNPRNPLPLVDGVIEEAHHRLAAAILLCLDLVPVVIDSPVWFSEDRSVGPSGHSYQSFNNTKSFDSPYPIHL